MQDIGEALQKAMDYCPVPFVFFCPAHPFSSKDRSEGCSGNRRASGGTALFAHCGRHGSAANVRFLANALGNYAGWVLTSAAD